MTSKKHKKVCKVLNYVEHLLVSVPTIMGCVSISAFASLIGIPIKITNFAKGLKVGAIAAGINKHMSIIKKKNKKKYRK